MPITVMPVGALVDVFGAPYTLAVMGGLLVLAMLAVGAFVPTMRARGG